METEAETGGLSHSKNADEFAGSNQKLGKRHGLDSPPSLQKEPSLPAFRFGLPASRTVRM